MKLVIWHTIFCSWFSHMEGKFRKFLVSFQLFKCARSQFNLEMLVSFACLRVLRRKWEEREYVLWLFAAGCFGMETIACFVMRISNAYFKFSTGILALICCSFDMRTIVAVMVSMLSRFYESAGCITERWHMRHRREYYTRPCLIPP